MPICDGCGRQFPLPAYFHEAAYGTVLAFCSFDCREEWMKKHADEGIYKKGPEK